MLKSWVFFFSSPFPLSEMVWEGKMARNKYKTTQAGRESGREELCGTFLTSEGKELAHRWISLNTQHHWAWWRTWQCVAFAGLAHLQSGAK